MGIISGAEQAAVNKTCPCSQQIYSLGMPLQNEMKEETRMIFPGFQLGWLWMEVSFTNMDNLRAI